MSNAELERMVETSDEWITSRTGIRERRIAGANETTSDMALEAARRAMTAAGVTAADIDLIIVATITPDMPFPSTACLVQQKLGAHRAVAFDIEAGKELASKFPKGKAAIHQNHGLFTVGSTVEEAAFWFLSMDRSCHAQLLAMAAGTPKLIKHEYAQYTREQTGHSLAGWFQFQPLWQEICRTDPELFD